MQIEILSTAQEAQRHDFANSVAVVIDVFRATSVITTAIHNGAAGVIPVATIDDAFSLAKSLNTNDILLGGERNADPIPGFNIGNSPQLYTPQVIAGKTLILTTTNGTLALQAARYARSVLVASVLNYKTVANHLRASNPDSLVIVCSGTNGQPALEDELCAALICHAIDNPLTSNTITYLSDQSVAIRLLAETLQPHSPHDIFSLSHHYQTLVTKGYADDVNFCLNHLGDIPTLPSLCSDGIIRQL